MIKSKVQTFWGFYFVSYIRVILNFDFRYEIQAESLKKSPLLNNDASFHKLAAAILFNPNTGSFLDNPEGVRGQFLKSFPRTRSDSRLLHTASHHSRQGSGEVKEIKKCLDLLKAMVHCYSGSSTVTHTGSKFIASTKVSLSVIPSPNVAEVS